MLDFFEIVMVIWKIIVFIIMFLGRFLCCFVFVFWWLVKLVDFFKEFIFLVSVVIWCCSCSNCFFVVLIEWEIGGLIGVELGILYDSWELEWLFGGEIVNEVFFKFELWFFVNCKLCCVLVLLGWFFVWFFFIKMCGWFCFYGIIVC